MGKDDIFNKPIKKQFEFDEEVASVFDDMIERSVPFYRQNLKLCIELVAKNTPQNAKVYDLGSSTGTFAIALAKKRPDLEIIGLDNSAAMIERAQKKAKAFGVDVSFIEADILKFNFKNANAFVANYTLQFIRPLKRQAFVKSLAKELTTDGILLMSEKIITEDKRLNKQLIDIYYNYKKNQGYSEFEIAQKREALENVLVPFTLRENEEMLKEAGFGFIEPIFRWANFTTIFARKR